MVDNKYKFNCKKSKNEIIQLYNEHTLHERLLKNKRKCFIEKFEIKNDVIKIVVHSSCGYRSQISCFKGKLKGNMNGHSIIYGSFVLPDFCKIVFALLSIFALTFFAGGKELRIFVTIWYVYGVVIFMLMSYMWPRIKTGAKEAIINILTEISEL